MVCLSGADLPLSRSSCRFGRSRSTCQRGREGRGNPHEPNSGENDAFHGHGHGNEGIRSGRPAEARSVCRDAESNAELAKAGVLLAAEGLAASSKGARVKFSGDQRTVIDGPFAETKELVAGFSIIQVKSREEAIEWVKRVPNIFPNGEAEIEIRKVMDVEDFGDAFTPNPEIAKIKIK